MILEMIFLLPCQLFSKFRRPIFCLWYSRLHLNGIFLKKIHRAVSKLFAYLFKKTKMFTKQLTRAPQYILIKSSSFYIARLKLSHDLSRRFLKTSKIHFKSASFSTEIGRTRTIELFMIRPPKLRRMIRCTQHFQQIGLT